MRVPVLNVWDEGPLMRGVRLGPLPSYRAGQAVRVKHEAGSAYYALASAWGRQRSPELLLRRGGGLADVLIRELEVGRELELDGPLGPGFALDIARGKDVLLAAAGSAISAIRTVVESISDDRSAFGRVTLYYGQERPGEFAYLARHEHWRANDIDVVLCAHDASEGWGGEVGFVQDVIVERGVTSRELVAYVCGMPGMMSGVREALQSFGVTSERVLSNT